MKIAFVQTYPVYHDLMSVDQWLKLDNRDKWMPGILAGDSQHLVEMWGTAQMRRSAHYEHQDFSSFPIELFPVSKQYRNSKFDYSDAMVSHARSFQPDLVFLKGVDGGTGIHLLNRYLLKEDIPFIFVVGGKFYNRYVPKASGVLYETEFQKNRLMNPGWKFWRKPIPESKLIQLPKSINTHRFAPVQGVEKEFDIVSVGRLISNYKNYDPLGELSKRYKVAIIGDGPMKTELAAKYPKLHLPGFIPNHEIPEFLNKGRLFFHAGLNDFFPRVIPEAMACGIPCIGFAEAIAEEVIPDRCGLRISTSDYQRDIDELLSDRDKLHTFSVNARQYAVDQFGLYSSREPMYTMLDRIQSRR